ncbi:MAG: CHAT domain-containing protein [Cyclobacteriaceae bacterium]
MKILKWLIFFFLATWSASGQNDQRWKLYYDSTQYYWAKDWNKTVTLLENAERSAISDLGLYHQNYLTILNDLGTAYWKAKNYPKAEKALAQSLDLKSEVYPVNDKEVILSISNLAGFYAEQGHWKKSKSLYNKILSADPAHIPSDIYVSAAQSLVSLYDLNQQPDSADYLLGRIEKWNVITANSYLAFQHQFYRAKIHRKLQQYAAAEAELEQLVSSLLSRKEPELIELYIQTLQEQGILYLQTGAYSRAEKNLLQAYQLVTAERNRDYLLTELSNNLAQVYDKLNIFDKALLYYQESLGRCRLSYDENSLPCVILQNNIAGIHLKENNVTQAIADYQKVIVEFEKLLTPTDPLNITSLNNLATAYRKNSQFKLALEYLDKAQRLLKKNGLGNSDLASTLLNNIAVLNTAQGDFDQAAIHYENAYEIKRAIYGDNSVLLLDLISNLAVTYWALNKPQEAIPLFKKSMALATRQVTYIFPNLNENEQVQFYQKLKEDFERFNTIAIHWADKDGELVAQMFQNRTIIKSLQFFTHQRRKNHIGMKNDTELNNLVSRLKDRRDRLGHLYQLPLDHLHDGNSLAALEKEIDTLEKSISLKSSEALYADGLTAEEIQWKSLVPKLQPNEAIVEMVRFRKYDRQSSRKKDYFGFTDSVYYAALILTRETKEKPAMVIFNDGNNLESRFFHYYKNAMKYNVEDDLSYHFFWEPLEKPLLGKTKIYISADGVYHKINVNTLRDPQTKKFLLEKFDIVYLLNPIQFLENKTPLNKVKRNAVLMGDPVFDVDLTSPRERTVGFNHFIGLPGTQEELRAIDKVLKGHAWKTSLYLKGAATESNLKAVESPSILHLASHGFFSSEIVALNTEAKKEFLFHSGIVLTGANKSLSTGSTSFNNDGIVTAFEVMNLDLTNTQLVVLSACETGLGKIENGEGVFGLQRSFMQAGARNVLISLWKVDDEATRDLMINFYQYLALGNSLHDSLKKAQAEQAKLVPNPSLWGGFVLVGNN